MIKKRCLRILLSLVLGLLMACGNPAAPPADDTPVSVPVTAISISSAGDATTISTSGGTLQLTATVTPTDATNKTVTWTVDSGSAYASVSSTGLVTALDNGTALIKAAASDGSAVSATFSVTVSGQRGTVRLPITSDQTIDEDKPVIYQASSDLSFSGTALKASLSASTVTDDEVTFDLLPGTYYFRAFHDLDNNGSLSAGDLFTVSTKYRGGPGIVYVPRQFTVEAGAETSLNRAAFYDMYGDWAWPTDSGTIRMTVNYTGALGPVSADNIIAAGVGTDPKMLDNLQMAAGIYLEENNIAAYWVVEAGTYYAGSYFDEDGNYDIDPNPANHGPDDGDPIRLYNNKVYGTDDGDPIIVTAGQQTSIVQSFNDTQTNIIIP